MECSAACPGSNDCELVECDDGGVKVDPKEVKELTEMELVFTSFTFREADTMFEPDELPIDGDIEDKTGLMEDKEADEDAGNEVAEEASARMMVWVADDGGGGIV